MAKRLATGWLCSEDMFGCRGDDEELAELLARVAVPDAAGWRPGPPRYHGWSEHRSWRWHGRLKSSGERCFVEVCGTQRLDLDTTLLDSATLEA